MAQIVARAPWCGPRNPNGCFVRHVAKSCRVVLLASARSRMWALVGESQPCGLGRLAECRAVRESGIVGTAAGLNQEGCNRILELPQRILTLVAASLYNQLQP